MPNSVEPAPIVDTPGILLRARSAVAWSAAADLLSSLFQFGVSIVLARLLTPDEYGLWAFANSVVSVILVFGARTFLEFILQERDAPHLNALFTFGLVLQLVLFLFSCGAAVALSFTSWGRAAGVLLFMSSIFLLDLPAQYHSMLLQRDFHFRTFQLCNISGVMLGNGVALLLAWKHFGVYSLAAASVLSSVPLAFTLFATRNRPKLDWRFSQVTSSVAFGLHRIKSGVLVTVRNMLEDAVVSRFFGFGTLGTFDRAQSLSILALQRVTGTVTAALFPILAQLQHEQQRFRAFARRLFTLAAWIAFPAALGLSVVGSSSVVLLFGAQWEDTVALLPFASVSTLVGVLFFVSYRLMLAGGLARECSRLDMVALFGNSLALGAVFLGDIRVYLVLLALVHSICLFSALRILAVNGFLDDGDAARAILKPLFGTAIAGLATFTISRAFTFPVVWTRLAVDTVVISGAYAVTMRVLFPADLLLLIESLPLSARIKGFLRF